MFRISKVGFIVFTSIAYVCKCDSCPATTPTVKKVDSCPETEDEWKAASSRKKCNQLADYKGCGKTLEYHCLLNQWGNETLEVCAPPWFISGFCAMFNTAEERVIDNFNIDCSKFTNGSCPTRYLSSEAYKYQKCYKKQSTLSSRNTCTCEQEDNARSKVAFSTSNQLPLTIPLILMSIAVLVLSILLALTCKGKIGRGGSRSDSKNPRKTEDNDMVEATQSTHEHDGEITAVRGYDEGGTNEQERLIPPSHQVQGNRSKDGNRQTHTDDVAQKGMGLIDTSPTKPVAELKKIHEGGNTTAYKSQRQPSITGEELKSLDPRNSGQKLFSGMEEKALTVMNSSNNDEEFGSTTTESNGQGESSDVKEVDSDVGATSQKELDATTNPESERICGNDETQIGDTRGVSEENGSARNMKNDNDELSGIPIQESQGQEISGTNMQEQSLGAESDDDIREPGTTDMIKEMEGEDGNQ